MLKCPSCPRRGAGKFPLRGRRGCNLCGLRGDEFGARCGCPRCCIPRPGREPGGGNQETVESKPGNVALIHPPGKLLWFQTKPRRFKGSVEGRKKKRGQRNVLLLKSHEPNAGETALMGGVVWLPKMPVWTFKAGLSILLPMDASSKARFLSEQPRLPQRALADPHPTPCSTAGAMQQYCTANTFPSRQTDRLAKGPTGEKTKSRLSTEEMQTPLSPLAAIKICHFLHVRAERQSRMLPSRKH